jgi:hypothetical protein
VGSFNPFKESVGKALDMRRLPLVDAHATLA